MTTTQGAGELVREAVEILRHVKPLEQPAADVGEGLAAASDKLTAALLRVRELRAYLDAMPGGAVLGLGKTAAELLARAVEKVKGEL